MSDMREQHLNEPVFGSIDAEQMLAKQCSFKKIDLNTVKAENLAFIEKYRVTIEHDGEVNGLVMWYSVSFSLSHVEVNIDGSPFNEKKIFSQLVVYLKNKTKVRKGNVVCGSIAFQNDKEDKFKTYLKISANVEATKFSNVQYYTVE